MKLTTVLCLCALALPLNLFSQNDSEGVISLAKSISSDKFFEYLGVLASDDFEGRGIGSAGYDKAADYIVENIKALGLQPGADDGSYFQPVLFETRKIQMESVVFSFSLGEKTYSAGYGENISILPNIKSPEIKVNAEVVFVGFGLDIPELGINDYKDIDVKDKIVMITFGLPDNVDKKKYRKYIDPFAKLKMLEKKGVAGVIFYTKTGIIQNLAFKQIHKFFSEEYFDFDEKDIFNPMLGFDSKLIIYAKKDAITEAFKFNGLNFKKTYKLMEEGQFNAFKLESNLEVSYKATVKKVMSKNIVAILPGSDPRLSSESLVLSAHLDHLGIGKAVKKDSIYNGAWDNASGCATLMSIAETYKKLPVAPKRTIVFSWVTGEEKGLLGSHYFAQKPTKSSGKIVADMSLDMAGGLFDSKDIIPMGYKMSNLSQAVDFATTALNIVSDTTSALEPEYFERSDHFSFVDAGIPALLVFGGMTAVDPKINGLKVYKTWEKKVYHSPADDMNQEFCKEAMMMGVESNFLISWYIANEIPVIQWKKESAQYKKYFPAEKAK